MGVRAESLATVKRKQTDCSMFIYCSEYLVEPKDPGPEGMMQRAEVGSWKEKAEGLDKRWEIKVKKQCKSGRSSAAKR